MVNVVVLFNEVEDFVFVELGDVEFLVPGVVEFVLLDEGAHVDVFVVVGGEAVLEDFGEGGFAGAGGARDQDVRERAGGLHSLLFHHQQQCNKCL